MSEKELGKVVDVTTEIDNTIVNPAKLPLDTQFDICQRCHVQGAAVYKEGKTPFDFRPGMRLADVENVFWPRNTDSLRQFVMASHPDRLKQSSCFTASYDEAQGYTPMTCTTCHDPHVSIETLGVDHYRQVCQSCHGAGQEDAVCTEDEAVRAAQGDNCVACHMPVSGSSDIPHVRITDHWIRTPDRAVPQLLSQEEADAQSQFIRLASLIDEAPTARDIALGYLVYYEEVTNHPGFIDSALVYLDKAERETSRQAVAEPRIRAWFLRDQYEAIIRLVPSVEVQAFQDGWTFYRIGEAFLANGQVKEALPYFVEAVQREPRHLRFRNKLALAYSQDGQLNQALTHFNTVLNANPKYSDAYNNRGFTYILLGDYEGAEADFLAALALDPDLERALANLASLYYNTNRQAEARPYAERLMTLDPTNAQYNQLWDLVKAL